MKNSNDVVTTLKSLLASTDTDPMAFSGPLRELAEIIAPLEQEVRKIQAELLSGLLRPAERNIAEATLMSIMSELDVLRPLERQVELRTATLLKTAINDKDVKHVAHRYSKAKFVEKNLPSLTKKVSGLPQQIYDGIKNGCKATKDRYLPLKDSLNLLVEALKGTDEQQQHVLAEEIIKMYSTKLHVKISQIDEIKIRLLGDFIDAFRAISPALKTASIGDKNHGGRHD